MAQLTTVRRVVIIVDTSLKTQILDTVTELGACGYNWTHCVGKGLHSVTGDMFTGDSLMRVEVLCSDAVAMRILDYVHDAKDSQFASYPLVAFSHTIEIDSRNRSITNCD